MTDLELQQSMCSHAVSKTATATTMKLDGQWFACVVCYRCGVPMNRTPSLGRGRPLGQGKRPGAARASR